MLTYLIQFALYLLSLFSGDVHNEFLPHSSADAVGDEYSDLKYLEMFAPPTDGGQKFLSMASFYNEAYFTGKCSATIFRHDYETDFKRPAEFTQNPAVSHDKQPTTSWYSNSGYDRGHISPNADNSYNDDAIHQSFYVTNIAPQDPWTNRGPWGHLEEGLRSFAQTQTQDLFIVTCTHGQSGTIHDGGIVVPEYYYKLVCALDESKDYPTASFYGLNTLSTSEDRDARQANVFTPK